MLIMRKPRRMLLVEGSQCFHVVLRVNGRHFLLGEEAKERFATLLRKVERFANVTVVTWTMLDNHLHLVLQVPETIGVDDLPEEEFWARLSALYSREEMDAIRARIASFYELNGGATAVVQEKAYRQDFVNRMHDLSEFMKTLLQRFTVWFNKRHERVGRLWEQRFKSVVIEGGWDALMTVAGYVDLNAVRAGMVEDPKDYRWCGYAEAVAGKPAARRGLGFLMQEEALREGRAIPNWRVVGREYRRVLFGMGEAQVTASGEVVRKGASAEAVAAVRESGGELPLAALLRCRVRYFTDGVVIGSKGFVDGFFEAKREYFGPKRKDGGRKMRGGDWGELRSLRDLRERLE